jgi:TolA-binding protein
VAAKWIAAVVIVSGLAVGGVAVTSTNDQTAPVAPSVSSVSTAVATLAVPPPPVGPASSANVVKNDDLPRAEPQNDVARGLRVEVGSAPIVDGHAMRAEANEGAPQVAKEARRLEASAASGSVESEANDSAPAKAEGASVAASPAAMTTSTATSLTLEVARLDRAKSAVASGQGAVALRELDAYAREFPTGSLRGEATLLRVDALLLAGDRAGAAALARALVQAAPQSPLAPRLRGIAGMSAP